MTETIKLIPTSSIPSGAELENPNNAFTGIDDDTFASLTFAKGKSPSDPTSGEVQFVEFQGPNGETAADIASKIEHLNNISFKVKYQADENTGAVDGLQLMGWGVESAYVASSEPQIVDIAFNPNPMVATIDEYWQAVSSVDAAIVFVCDITSLDTNPATLNIYGMEMEISYEPKAEPDPSKIDPNSSAEVIYGDTGSTKTYDVEIKDLAVENGLLNGTAVGVAQKSFTGRVDQIKFAFNDVPIDGVGGGSGGSNVAHYWFAENVQFVDDPENPGSKYMVSAWNVFSEKPEATIGEYEASMYGYPVTWNGNKVETAEPLLGDIDNGSVIAITRLRIIDTFDPETSESLGPKVSCDATYTINGFNTYGNDPQALFTFNYTLLNPKVWVGTTYVGYLLCSLTGPANWQVRINYSSEQG